MENVRHMIVLISVQFCFASHETAPSPTLMIHFMMLLHRICWPSSTSAQVCACTWVVLTQRKNLDLIVKEEAGVTEESHWVTVIDLVFICWTTARQRVCVEIKF